MTKNLFCPAKKNHWAIFVLLITLLNMSGALGSDSADEPKFVAAVTTISDVSDPTVNRAGIPLGGIGAGKIDITPDGSITNVTTNCNIESPICDGYASTPAKIIKGGVPGIFWGLRDSKGSKILKVYPLEPMIGVKAENIEFDGRLPKAKLSYKNIGPIDVELIAFSPLVLGDTSEDYRDSSIPGAIFTFELKNKTEQTQNYTLFYSWQNMCGCTGFYNERGWGINDTRENQVDFRLKCKFPGAWHYTNNREVHPRGKGNYSVRIEAPNGTEIQSRNWKDAAEIWEQISKNVVLISKYPWTNGSNSIIAVSGNLKPGEKIQIRFAVGWYFSNLTKQWDNDTNYGRMYEHWFKDSWEVAEYLLLNADRLYALTTQWQDALWQSNLPQWLKYKLCDDLFPMITNSWYTKKGDFTISEAPTNMGAMMGTIDQRNSSQAPYLLCFPKLCKSELELFRARQVKPGDNNQMGYHYDFNTGMCDTKKAWLDQSGAIPHDFSNENLHDYTITPGPVWIAGHWPDLLSGYVLQWYAYYCWTNDPHAKEVCYKSCKATMAFLEKLDFNRDGIPELWGAGSSSYDNNAFPYYGNSPYVATFYMAAMKAMEKWACQEGDIEYAENLKKRRRLANQTLLQDNWTGDYFRTWRHNEYKKWDGSERAHGLESNSIMVSQLAGQWYASMMSLGYILDYEKIETALKTITENNHSKISGGAPIEFWPKTDGSAEKWGESWPHYTETYYSALAIYESQKDAGLEQLLKIWNVMNKCGARWDSGLGIGGQNNEHVSGRWYMSNTASWFNLLAMTGVWVDLPAKRFTLAPNLPPSMGTKLCKIPLFTEPMTGLVDFELNANRTKACFTVSRFEGKPMEFKEILTRVPMRCDLKEVKVNNKKISPTNYTFDKINGYLILEVPLRLGKNGDAVTIEMLYQ